jgi:Spy/CpxP family protein refolding chaperone
MIKNALTILTIIFLANCTAYAHDCNKIIPQKPTFKERRQMDRMLDERLNLTSEQQEQLRKNRSEHRKQMDNIIENMEYQHKKIRDVYYSGIPKFQADIKTAPMKAELVILKQNADKLRQENRKNFEQILTQEQKVEFAKLKKEMHEKHHKPIPVEK